MTIKKSRKELSYARPGTSSSGLHTQDMETLPVREQMRNLHGSPEPQVYFYSEGVKYEAT